MDISFPVGSILDSKGTRLWSIDPESTVFDAISLMAEKNIGALPVVKNERLLGIISERDYTRKVILHGRASRETRVADIMTHPVITVSPQDSVEDGLELMTENRTRHLVVVERGQILGIISIGDLVNSIIRAQANALDDLQRYVTGSYPG